MDLRTTIAAQNYAQARTATTPQPGAENSATPSFADFANNFTSALSNHEAVARSAMVGGADPHSLVQALASSQLAVETVATVRDRVVEAYQELLRMPV
jgi:flagellar hook-basal body complex protein FliE